MYDKIRYVKTILGIGEELTDSEIEEYINASENYVYARFNGNYLYDTFIMRANINGSFNRDLYLFFPLQNNGVIGVYRNGVKLTTAEYSIDYNNNYISLSDDLSLNEYDRITILYKSDILEEYKVFIAIRNIIQTRLVNLPNNVNKSAILEQVNKRIEEIEKTIRSRPYVGGWIEHKELGDIW